MRNAEERTLMVMERVRALKRRRRRRENVGLSALSVFLVLALVTLLGQFGGGGAGMLSEGMAASLLAESAGGYVLTAVAAFMAGVVIAVTLRNKLDKQRTEKKTK